MKRGGEEERKKKTEKDKKERQKKPNPRKCPPPGVHRQAFGDSLLRTEGLGQSPPPRERSPSGLGLPMSQSCVCSTGCRGVGDGDINNQVELKPAENENQTVREGNLPGTRLSRREMRGEPPGDGGREGQCCFGLSMKRLQVSQGKKMCQLGRFRQEAQHPLGTGRGLCAKDKGLRQAGAARSWGQSPVNSPRL